MSQPPYQPPTPEQPADPPPGWNPPPGWVPPQHVITKKKGLGTGAIIAIVIGAIVVLCCGGGAIVAAVGGGSADQDGVSSAESAEASQTSAAVAAPAASDDAPTSSAPKPPPTKAAPKNPGIGSPVRDGDFEFTVTSVGCGVNRVGSQYLGQDAQGQFCLVTTKVRNIGDSSQLFDASSQKAYNAAGQTYDADSTASLYANPNTETFLNQINPGNTVTGKIVFDIPAGQKITRLEFHDSAFSGGAEIAVG